MLIDLFFIVCLSVYAIAYVVLVKEEIQKEREKIRNVGSPDALNAIFSSMKYLKICLYVTVTSTAIAIIVIGTDVVRALI